MRGYKWTEKEDQIVIDNYSVFTAEEIANILPGRTRNAVLCRANKILKLNGQTDAR